MTNEVKQEAVDNFLASMDMSLTKSEQSFNVCSDAISYRWNLATQDAIYQGIHNAYEKSNIGG